MKDHILLRTVSDPRGRATSPGWPWRRNCYFSLHSTPLGYYTMICVRTGRVTGQCPLFPIDCSHYWLLCLQFGLWTFANWKRDESFNKILLKSKLYLKWKKYIPHYFFFKSTGRNQPVDIYDLPLSNSMGSVHSLEVLHGIPVVFHENHSISSC